MGGYTGYRPTVEPPWGVGPNVNINNDGLILFGTVSAWSVKNKFIAIVDLITDRNLSCLDNHEDLALVEWSLVEEVRTAGLRSRWRNVPMGSGAVGGGFALIHEDRFTHKLLQLDVNPSTFELLVCVQWRSEGKTLNSSVVVLSMTLNSCGAIEEMILWVLLQFAPLHSWFSFLVVPDLLCS